MVQCPLDIARLHLAFETGSAMQDLGSLHVHLPTLPESYLENSSQNFTAELKIHLNVNLKAQAQSIYRRISKNRNPQFGWSTWRDF